MFSFIFSVKFLNNISVFTFVWETSERNFWYYGVSHSSMKLKKAFGHSRQAEKKMFTSSFSCFEFKKKNFWFSFLFFRVLMLISILFPSVLFSSLLCSFFPVSLTLSIFFPHSYYLSYSVVVLYIS